MVKKKLQKNTLESLPVQKNNFAEIFHPIFTLFTQTTENNSCMHISQIKLN